MSTSIPWWAKATPAPTEIGMRFADLWDALFGRIETFYRVELDGAWCMVEKRDMWEFTLTAPSGDVYTITEVRMTRRQFDNLPEFSGF